MMKKLLKIATVCSLAFSLSTATLVYANEPDPDPDPIITVGDGESSSSDVNATIELVNKTRYAIDVFYSQNLVFHYKIGSSFNPADFSTTASSSTVTLSEEENATKAKSESVEEIDGVWFGFNGVNNRVSVFNRSNADVKMAATSANLGTISSHESQLSINLFLNGDTLADTIDDSGAEPVVTKHDWEKRKLNVTSGKNLGELPEASSYEAAEALYDIEGKSYTTNMLELLKCSHAFSTKDGDTEGGRFSANPEQEVDLEHELAAGNIDTAFWTPVNQNDTDNVVRIAQHTLEGGNDYLGYALVYFDLSGKPFEGDETYGGMANYGESGAAYGDATGLGTITLTFSANTND